MMLMDDRTVESFNVGNTLIRMTKSQANLMDYSVSCEDIAKGTHVTVTYPHFTDASKAFTLAHTRARGLGDNLRVLLSVDTERAVWTGKASNGTHNE
jgi:hypothetical protein